MLNEIQPRALSAKDAAEYISVSASLLNHLRLGSMNGVDGPKFIRIGRSIRYLREDLDTWLDSFDKNRTIKEESSEL